MAYVLIMNAVVKPVGWGNFAPMLYVIRQIIVPDPEPVLDRKFANAFMDLLEMIAQYVKVKHVIHAMVNVFMDVVTRIQGFLTFY